MLEGPHAGMALCRSVAQLGKHQTSFQIKDNKLKMMSVYGNEYGRNYSRQNTTLMLQGSVNLEKKGSIYTISAFHTHLNGDDMTGGYEPVFMAIYKGDRSDFGIRGTRVVIAPAGC